MTAGNKTAASYLNIFVDHLQQILHAFMSTTTSSRLGALGTSPKHAHFVVASEMTVNMVHCMTEEMETRHECTANSTVFRLQVTCKSDCPRASRTVNGALAVSLTSCGGKQAAAN